MLQNNRAMCQCCCATTRCQGIAPQTYTLGSDHPAIPMSLEQCCATVLPHTEPDHQRELQ